MADNMGRLNTAGRMAVQLPVTPEKPDLTCKPMNNKANVAFRLALAIVIMKR